MRRSVVLAALSLAFCCDAATTVKRELKDLVASSEAIVHGRVVRHWSAWDASHRTIWTHYVVEAFEVMHGSERQIWTVSEPGGTVGDLVMDVSGAVPFVDGEEVLVLMRRMPNGALRITGSTAGKYSVAAGTGTKKTRSAGAEGPDLARLKSAIRTALSTKEGAR
jgi:hypothetical protein